MASLVFFHAHPDDEAIATGGTMALLADAGHRVTLVVATRGEVGEPAPGVLAPGEELGDRREVELRASAQILGVDTVEFLGYRDSGMVGEPTNDDPTCFWQADLSEAAQRLAKILTAVQADTVVTYDPNGVYGHPDHIQVYQVGSRAAEIAGVERVFWTTVNQTMIKQASEQGMFDEVGDDEPDDRVDPAEMGLPQQEITHAVDVMAAIDRKRASLAAHASQITEQSFFLAMDDDMFAMAFGTEWYVDAGRHRAEPIRQGEMLTSLLD